MIADQLDHLHRTPAIECDMECRLPFHVVHAVLRLDVGGLERIVVDLVRAGRLRGHRVTVLCLESKGTLAEMAESEGATVLALGKQPGRTPKLAEQIAKIIGSIQPDVIHTHQIGALWYVGPAARGVPVLHTEHIDNASKADGLLQKTKVRLLWHLATRYAAQFCCVSEDIACSARRWHTVASKKVNIVLNGIDTGRYAAAKFELGCSIRSEIGIPVNATVVGTVGRLNEVKRQDLLLEAVATMPTPVHALLVGDGPERRRLEQLAERLGIARRTHFAGYRSNPEYFLAAMNVFALSSRLEGLPLSLLEAWATGLPVISTAVGGIPAVLRDGVNGLLVPKNSAASLSWAIGRVLGDSTLAKNIAAAGLRTVRENFSLERMAEQYAARYKQISASSGVRRGGHS